MILFVKFAAGFAGLYVLVVVLIALAQDWLPVTGAPLAKLRRITRILTISVARSSGGRGQALQASAISHCSSGGFTRRN